MGVEFVNISISTTGLYVTSTRDYGTVAIVGDGGTAETDPILIGTVSEAVTTFSTSDLGLGVKLALQNGAAKVWAVETGTVTLASIKEGLAKIEGYDVQVVALANISETADNAYISDALANHVTSAATERIGVFQLAKGEDVTTMPTAISGLLTANSSRLVGIAHNSDNDVACAVAGVISGLKVDQSPLLKPIEGVTQTVGFTRTQINALEAVQLNVLVKPTYITSNSPVLGSAYTMGTALSGINYIDTRRVIDDLSYKLKSTLTDPNIIGEVKINKVGLSVLLNKLAGLMQNCVTTGEIDSYTISIPVLNALSKTIDSRSEAETTLITTSRTNRAISGQVAIEYSGVVHLINISVNMSV